MKHWFWLVVISVTLIWYIVVTALVAFRGWKDIRHMLNDLKEEND